MVSLSSNELNSIQSLIDKNESSSNINLNSKKSNVLLKANSLVSLNKKNCISTKNKDKNKIDSFDIMNKEYKNGRNQKTTYYNFFNKLIPKSVSKTFASKLNDRNKIIYLDMKNIKKNNNYSNYYVSGNLFHNDYITDFISGKCKIICKDKNEIKKDQMKETDNKIEELVKSLNIYPNKTLNKSQSQKLIDTEKTIDNDKININIINENNNNNNNDLIKKKNIKNSFKNGKKAEKFLIKGTNIISPFCDFARDHYLYKKIFYYSEKKKNLKSDYCLDNKLNIIYSENEKQYKQNLIKLNEIYKKLGRNKVYNLEPSESENKLRGLKKRVEFMKRIVDYTYPNMVLTKIREQDKITYEKNTNYTNIITSKINRNNYNTFNKQISLGLKKSLNIQKCFDDKKLNKEVT